MLERRNDAVVLIVEDNGRGFDAEQTASGERRGLGLRGMRERAALIGGTIEIETAPGKGTTIFVNAPARSKSGRLRTPD